MSPFSVLCAHGALRTLINEIYTPSIEWVNATTTIRVTAKETPAYKISYRNITPDIAHSYSLHRYIHNTINAYKAQKLKLR